MFRFDPIFLFSKKCEDISKWKTTDFEQDDPDPMQADVESLHTSANILKKAVKLIPGLDVKMQETAEILNDLSRDLDSYISDIFPEPRDEYDDYDEVEADESPDIESIFSDL